MLFADDQVVLAEDDDDASYMMGKLMEQYEMLGLNINVEKTQYMAIGREKKRDGLVAEKSVIKRTSDIGIQLSGCADYKGW